jgi:hypothetical protein
VANEYGLDVFALKSVPDGAIPLKEQRIALYADVGTRLALDLLGFEYDEVSRNAINAGILADYDVFINLGLRWGDIDDAGKASFSEWYAGGGNYIALPDRGRAIDFAIAAGIADVAYGYIDGNGIVALDYDTDDPIAAGYLEDGHAFVYRSVWFTDWDDLDVSARVSEGDFFKSGYWPEWQTSGAEGMPIVVHGSDGMSDFTLIGVDATFRGHPEGSFRLIGNAIYNGLE